MLVGYMRVSTSGDRQVLDLQRDALIAAGVDERHLFEDRLTGSRGDRPGRLRNLQRSKSLLRRLSNRPRVLQMHSAELRTVHGVTCRP